MNEWSKQFIVDIPPLTSVNPKSYEWQRSIISYGRHSQKSEHLHLMFQDLYGEERHSNVTLVCDDQNQFRAHKIVLSSCSPVFKKIIDMYDIYRKGI